MKRVLDGRALWSHQRKAIDWCCSHRASYLHLKMGVGGKSRVTIDTVDRLEAMRVLIVAPKSIVDSVWPLQFATWSPRPWVVASSLKGSVQVRTIRAAEAVRTSKLEGVPIAVVVTYAALLTAKFLQWAQSLIWDVIVYDEIHGLKSSRGKTSRAAAKLRMSAKKLIGLSGTPMPHDPLDIWAQFRALDPSVLGTSFVAFRAQYANMGGYRGKEILSFKNQQHLADRMSRITFSPPAKDVEVNLPPTTDIVRHVMLSPKAARLYSALDDKLRATIEEGSITYSNGLVRLLRMSQLTGGLAVVEPQEAVGDLTTQEIVRRLTSTEDAGRVEIEVCNAKEEALREILDETDEPLVAFGLFRHDMESIKRAAGEENYCELSGTRNDLAAWQGGARRVIGIQIAAGSMGITLVRSHICAFLSTGFNRGQYEQARARLDRPGQEHPVLFYHLHARGTIDEIVYRVLRERGDLVQRTLDLLQHRTYEPHT